MNKPAPRRVTMRDVAERSGVSYQTVSRVINGHPSVASQTRARVLQAIADLNYRPSKAARSLAARRSNTLAVITYSMKYYGPTQMVVNIEQCAREAGYDLIYSDIDPLTGNGVNMVIDRLLRWSVEGIMLIAPVASSHYDHLVRQFQDIPLIQIDNKPGAEGASVIVDQECGSRVITEHLISLGHECICEIRGPMNWFGAAARHRGFVKALHDADLKSVASVEGNWMAQSGYEACQRLLAGNDFTAIVVANDQMALGAMRALSEAGRRVPDDVSVVGFDDIPEAAYFAPPLTTIQQDFAALGRQGLQYLIDLIQQTDDAGGQRVIKPHLVERGSTLPPT